jgi:hypothetical protein
MHVRGIKLKMCLNNQEIYHNLAITYCSPQYYKIFYPSLQSQDTSAQSGGPPVNAIVYIQKLLDLKDRYDRFLVHAFTNDKYFKQETIL